MLQISKNTLKKNQTKKLVNSLKSFCAESGVNQDPKAFVLSSLERIKDIVSGNGKIDQFWLLDDGKELGFCLTRFEYDSDGSMVLTAYQLYLPPSMRGWSMTNKISKFLRFYAQKHRCSRFLILSTRLDKIKAYQRGIGNRFKIKAVIFEELL